MIVLVLLAAVNAPVGLPVHVIGTSRCPTPSEVAAILPELLPITNEARPDSAWIETAGLDLSITLRDPEGNTLLSRRITSHGTCWDLANAAAVVIATWKTERTPELSLLQPGVAPPAQVQTENTPPARPPAQVLVPAPAATERRRRLSIDLAAALGASANGMGWATRGRIEVGLRRQRVGLRVSLAGDTERDRSIEDGVASWRRLSVGLGPTIAILNRAVILELGAQCLAGITMVRGQSFDSNQRHSGFMPGLASTVRLGLGRGWARPYLEAGGQVWLAPEDLAVERSDLPAARVQLPRADLHAMLGLSFLLYE